MAAAILGGRVPITPCFLVSASQEAGDVYATCLALGIIKSGTPGLFNRTLVQGDICSGQQGAHSCRTIPLGAAASELASQMFFFSPFWA